MRDVVKVVKDVVKFVGDSVKEYLKAADANKELVKVAKDLEDAQVGLKKSIGEATLELAKEIQIAEAASGALGALQTLLHGDTDENIAREQRMNDVLAAQTNLKLAQADLDVARVSKVKADIQAASDAVDAAEIKLREAKVAQGLDVSLADSAGATTAARARAAARKKEAEDEAKAARDAAEARQKVENEAGEKRLQARADVEAKKLKEQEAYDQRELDAVKRQAEEVAKVERQAADEAFAAQQKDDERSAAASKKQSDQVLSDAKKDAENQRQQWGALGNSIGSAFVGAFNNVLDSLLSGGENDPTKTLLVVLDAVWAVVGTAIGIAFQNPALGQAIGALGSVGTHAIAGAATKKTGASTLTAHNGAWVGAPKYHDGGWVGRERDAILLEDERVFSHQEIRNAGGPAAVDAFAAGRGGGGGDTNVYIQAIDSKDATAGYMAALGKAQRRAQLSGYGSLSIKGAL